MQKYTFSAERLNVEEQSDTSHSAVELPKPKMIQKGRARFGLAHM